MKHRVFVALVLLPILLGYVCAQASAELDRLDEKLTRYFDPKNCRAESFLRSTHEA